MTLDPLSVAVGIVATHAFSAMLFGVLVFVDQRRARKERDRALDKLLADVAIKCVESRVETPTDVRVN